MPEFHVAARLTTINGTRSRVAMHTVRTEVLEAQARSAWFYRSGRCRSLTCPNEVYERAMSHGGRRAVSDRGFHPCGLLATSSSRMFDGTAVKFLAGSGLTPIFPLFGVRHRDLARTTDRRRPAGADHVPESEAPAPSFPAPGFFSQLLAVLPADIAPCAERSVPRARTRDQCSVGRCRSRPASSWSATASSSRTCC